MFMWISSCTLKEQPKVVETVLLYLPPSTLGEEKTFEASFIFLYITAVYEKKQSMERELNQIADTVEN